MANCDEGNQETTNKKRESLFQDEKLSAEKMNSESIPDGYEYREQDAKSYVMSCLRGSYNYPVPFTTSYLRGGHFQLLFPISVYKPSEDNSFFAQSDRSNRDREEFASTQSTTRTAPSFQKQEKTVGNTNGKPHSEKGNEFESDEVAKKRRVEWYGGNSETRNIADERARYRERRKRNNASAKKSRDVRRVRELETQMKAAFLTKENMRLLAELMAEQQENVRLTRLLSAKM